MDRNDIATSVETTTEMKTAEEMGTIQSAPIEEPNTADDQKDNTTNETSSEVPKQETKTFFDSSETKTEATKEKTVAELQKEFDDYKAAVEKEKLDSEASNESAKKNQEKIKSRFEKLFGGEYDISKVDIKALLKAAAGEDYSFMSTDQLVEHSIKSNPNFANLSEEDKKAVMEDAISKLQGMNALEQADYRTELLNKLNKSGEDSELFKTLQEIQAEQNGAITDPEKYYQERVAREREDIIKTVGEALQVTINSFVGQKYNGFEVTKEMAEQMMAQQNSDISSFNEESRAQTLFKAVTYDDFGRFMYEKGKKEATISAANPSANIGSPVISENDNKQGFSAVTKDDFRKAN